VLASGRLSFRSSCPVRPDRARRRRRRDRAHAPL